MEPALLPWIFVVVSGGVGFVLARRRLARRASDWRLAAEACGLRVVEEALGLGWKMRASSRDVRVRIERRSEEEGRYVAEVVLLPRTWTHPAIAVHVPRLHLGSRESTLPTEVHTGDAGFDAAVYLSGPTARVLALVDAVTRRDLLDLARTASIQAGAGRVLLQVEESALEVTHRRLLEIALRVTARFGTAFDDPAELARQLDEELVPGARERRLEALAREFPESPFTREKLEQARTDPSPAVRLVAGRELGEAGIPILVALLDATEAPDVVVAEAVRALGRSFPVERLEELLKAALRERRLHRAMALVELAGRLRLPPISPLLARVVAVERGELAQIAARSLGAIGVPMGESELLAAVDRENGELALAALWALERIGTVGAVMALRGFAEGGGRAPEIRRAVARTVAAIQARAHGASPGQLSLAAAPSGQLSLVPDAAGKLSFAGDEAGRLSEPSAPA